MGGTSLDITVLEVSNGMYSVLSSIQKENFGGHQITDVIADFCSSEFQRYVKYILFDCKILQAAASKIHP